MNEPKQIKIMNENRGEGKEKWNMKEKIKVRALESENYLRGERKIVATLKK